MHNGDKFDELVKLQEMDSETITNEELAKLYKQASNKASYEITSEIDRIKKPNFV